MGKKIVVVNASPRLNFNTDTLSTNAAKEIRILSRLSCKINDIFY